jgi:hypothetical protein
MLSVNFHLPRQRFCCLRVGLKSDNVTRWPNKHRGKQSKKARICAYVIESHTGMMQSLYEDTLNIDLVSTPDVFVIVGSHETDPFKPGKWAAFDP